VITVSFGGSSWCVLRKLAALARQTAGPGGSSWSSSTTPARTRVGDARGGRAWPFAVRVLRSERALSRPPRGAWAAREARGRWLWWSDDDVVPDDDALAAPPGGARRRRRRHDRGVRFVTAGGTAAGVRAGRPRPTHRRQHAAAPRRRRGRVRTTCPSCRDAYGGEDALIGFALRRRGVPFVAAPDAWVDHHGPSPAAGGDVRKAYDAGYNAAAIAGRYPRAAWPLGVHPLQIAVKRAVVPLLAWTGPRMAGDLAYLRGALDRAAAVPSRASAARPGGGSGPRP
jgi:hypothetical protein